MFVTDWQANDDWYELLPSSVGQLKHIRVQQPMTSNDDKENSWWKICNLQCNLCTIWNIQEFNRPFISCWRRSHARMSENQHWTVNSYVLFCSLAVLDSGLGHTFKNSTALGALWRLVRSAVYKSSYLLTYLLTMDVHSPCISVLSHSD